MSLLRIPSPLLAQLDFEVPELLGPVTIEEPINWPIWTAVGGIIGFLLLLTILAVVRARRNARLPKPVTLEALRAKAEALRTSREADEQRLRAITSLAREAVARHSGRNVSGLTPAEIRTLIPEQAGGLADALHACEQARFAGEPVDPAAIAEQVKRAINQLIAQRAQNGKGE